MLITLEQIRQFKGITLNLNTAKQLDPYIQEAEEFDIRPFLGEQLYIDFLEDFESSPSLQNTYYADLYNGSTYTYQGDKYKHEGLIAVMAYRVWARFVNYQNVNSTKYGIVKKTNDFSEPASDKTISRIVGQAQSGAVMYQERVKLYLDHHSDNIPKWKCSNKRKGGSIRLTAIGGNSSYKESVCPTCKCSYKYCCCHDNC